MINSKRLILSIFFIIFSFVTIGARLFFIQIWHHQEINSKVEKTITKNRPESSCRGMIFDKNGKILAMSTASYTIFADGKLIDNSEEVVKRLNKINIKVPKDILLSDRNRSYIPLEENLDIETMNLVKSWKIPGLGFVPAFSRKYPEKDMACYLLGVVSKEGAGLEGIEYSCDSHLSGKKIKDLRYRDGQGREIPDKLTDMDAIRGANVYLTIDRNLQFIAEQELEDAMAKTRSKDGVIIIQDPNTGEILALACRPNYKPESYFGSKSLCNPAISNIFEPGSTFKLITAAAALEEKLIKRNEVIWCENGKYAVYDHIIKDHEKQGLLNFDEVIEYSSNIGAAKIGQRLGKNILYKYIRQFGFNSKTGINLPGEVKGLLKAPNEWSGLSLPIISFGQEIGVTALQIINAYSAIANSGLLLEPVIIKKIVSPEGDVLYSPDKKIIRRTISEKTAKELKEILLSVVEKGTGQLAKIPGYKIGGKTGTAQKRDPLTKKYSTKLYTASFCGIVPVINPKLTILVILDEPKTDYWASTTAVPVFQKVCSRSLQYLRILPENETMLLANNKNIPNYPAAKKTSDVCRGINDGGM
ncbi:MAG: penicillin-binding protein 2 [Elusimicrobia bacterium]|nr:penicillin-binding protein 2 [Candidatus Liberimonas magnetica]